LIWRGSRHGHSSGRSMSTAHAGYRSASPSQTTRLNGRTSQRARSGTRRHPLIATSLGRCCGDSHHLSSVLGLARDGLPRDAVRQARGYFISVMTSWT
jgi:hypothetical protein